MRPPIFQQHSLADSVDYYREIEPADSTAQKVTRDRVADL
jgi:hypothetical protein